MKKLLDLLGKIALIIIYPTMVAALLVAGSYGIAYLFDFLNILQ